MILIYFLAPTDYLSVSTQSNFPVSSENGSTECVNISIVDDLAYEKDKIFFVIIESEPEVILPDPNVTVVIADDEGMLWRWSGMQECVTLSEGGGGRCGGSGN